MTEKNKEKNDHLMEDLSKPSTPTEYARLLGTGFAMGAADIVPGVSGGTMALIMGVYETLIDAIKSFNLDAIKLAIGFKVKELLEHIPFRFLIALGVGLIVAVLLLSSVLEGMIESESSFTYVFAFFAGLIVASIIAIGLKVQWNTNAIIAFVVGTVGAFFIVGLPSVGEQLGHAPPVLFFSGMIAICAMILPGISGSFILLILGQYEFILGAVRSFDIVSIGSVAVGAVIGLLGFSRVLSWLLKHYENTTIAVLVGFMLGSLRLILHRSVYFVDAETEAETLVQLGGGQIAIAVIAGVVGFLIVSFLDHLQTGENPVFSLVWKKAPAEQPVNIPTEG